MCWGGGWGVRERENLMVMQLFSCSMHYSEQNLKKKIFEDYLAQSSPPPHSDIHLEPDPPSPIPNNVIDQ